MDVRQQLGGHGPRVSILQDQYLPFQAGKFNSPIIALCGIAPFYDHINKFTLIQQLAVQMPYTCTNCFQILKAGTKLFVLFCSFYKNHYYMLTDLSGEARWT
jgi:hypothetical protein